jgi:hypothetical protein
VEGFRFLLKEAFHACELCRKDENLEVNHLSSCTSALSCCIAKTWSYCAGPATKDSTISWLCVVGASCSPAATRSDHGDPTEAVHGIANWLVKFTTQEPRAL